MAKGKKMGSLDHNLQRIMWSLWSVLQSTVGVILVLSVIPLVTPILLLLWIWRCFALLLVRIRHGYWARPASGMEALFALDSEGARAIISGVAILKGRQSVAGIRNHLSERIMEAKDAKGNFLHPKFRQVIEKRCGVVVWRWEDNFDVARHVRQLRTERRARLLRDEDDIVWELSARTNDPFVKGQAKWEVLVAPLKRYGKYSDSGQGDWDHTVVMLRVHHALGDGRSLVGLMVSALVDKPLPNPRPSPILRQPCNACTTRALRLLWSISHLPWVMIRILIRGDNSVLHGSRLGGTKHLAWSPPISLGALKRGRVLAGVSVNDLLLSGLSAALYRHFCLESPCVPDQVMTVIPVDVTVPGGHITLANRISLCTVPLPTDKKDSKDRLMTVHGRMNLLKTSPDVMVNYIALDLIANLLPAPIARRALNTHGVTLVTSNMPGPTEQINLFGEPVDDIMFWIPNKSRTGLGVSMLSYCGSVRVGLNVDSALIHNRELAQQLMDDLVTEVENALVSITPPEERMEQDTHVEDDGISAASYLSEVAAAATASATHSTDEYDDHRHTLTSYSDLHSSSGVRKLDDLDTSFGSDDYCPRENQQLLQTNLNVTRLEIQSFLTSSGDKRFLNNKLMTRFNKSETDVNILATRLEDSL